MIIVNETHVWVISQEISKQNLLVGVYSTHNNAKEVVQYIVDKEDEQLYRKVDEFLWLGATRRIEIRAIILDRNPAIK